MATVTAARRTILLRADDNVVVATQPIPVGFSLEMPGYQSITVHEPIALGHKVAVAAVPPGEPIRKYGQTIGFATRLILPGEWVHVHNVAATLFARDYDHASEVALPAPTVEPRTFAGYLRDDGRVGTRNYVVVISAVNCSASTSRLVAERFRGPEWQRDFPHVDGVFAITHKSGCGMQIRGPDHQRLERVLAGFAHHPNVAACVLVGLGCEVSQASEIVEVHDLIAPGTSRTSAARKQRPTVVNIQEQGGISRTVEAVSRAVLDLLPVANAVRRTTQPASKLCLALECGGSDGNSGITANPALGVAADLVVASGGTAVLGETTEIYGAEHLLTRRAVRPEVGAQLIERIQWWEWYAGIFGADLNNNPSPGNKAGGLTTIYEKSLGALAKAGSSPLTAVVGFGEPTPGPGLVFMDTPGFDPVCTTGLVAGGANVLVFTTGRGSVLGLKPTPCIKMATNTPMFDRMGADMDIDAGSILAGESIEAAGQRLFDLILDVASGQATKSEAAGIGEEEFAPWLIGPVL